jgi:Gpi18-like mannosyltransferase
MGILSRRQQVAYTVLLFVLLLLVVPRAGYEGDVAFWVRWATHIFEHGLGNVYQVADNNYNPFYHYILWLYAHLMGNVEKLKYYSHFLKAFTLIFDFAGAFWAASLVPERSRRFGLVLLLLLNVAYLYDTLLWIQVDSIYTFFSFGAVVLAAQRRPVASLLLYVLAFASKTQAIIFLPPLLLLWAPQWWQRPWHLVQGVVAGAVLATLLLAPFIWWSWENYLPRIIEINASAANTYPRISMNAFNFWYLVSGYDSPSEVSDLLPFAGLTFRRWGLLLFLGSSAVALLPLLVAAVRSLRPRAASPGSAPDLALVLLSCGIVPLLFSFFNTQMHERYWHAALLFLAAYGFVRRDYVPFVLMSAAYFFQLERMLQHLLLMHYDVLLFQPKFVAGLFGLLIGLVLWRIYRLAPWRTGLPGAQPAVASAPASALAAR